MRVYILKDNKVKVFESMSEPLFLKGQQVALISNSEAEKPMSERSTIVKSYDNIGFEEQGGHLWGNLFD